MPTRYKAMILGLILAYAAGATLAALWGWESRGQYKDQAEALDVQLRASQEALRAMRTQVLRVEQKREAASADLKEGLNAAPDWRDSAVPGPVADGLCKHLRCR